MARQKQALTTDVTDKHGQNSRRFDQKVHACSGWSVVSLMRHKLKLGIADFYLKKLLFSSNIVDSYGSPAKARAGHSLRSLLAHATRVAA
jgi:hypothetical protein